MNKIFCRINKDNLPEFYASDVHDKIPTDAIEITLDKHQEILTAINCENKLIIFDKKSNSFNYKDKKK